MSGDYATWGDQQRRFVQDFKDHPDDPTFSQVAVQVSWAYLRPIRVPGVSDTGPLSILVFVPWALRSLRGLRDGLNVRVRSTSDHYSFSFRLVFETETEVLRGTGTSGGTLITSSQRPWHMALSHEGELIVPGWPVRIRGRRRPPGFT